MATQWRHDDGGQRARCLLSPHRYARSTGAQQAHAAARVCGCRVPAAARLPVVLGTRSAVGAVDRPRGARPATLAAVATRARG
eukprot:2216514-Prymnesium_polylepis.1